jgi:hypothetical protein
MFKTETTPMPESACPFQFTVTPPFGEVYKTFDILSFAPSNHSNKLRIKPSKQTFNLYLQKNPPLKSICVLSSSFSSASLHQSQQHPQSTAKSSVLVTIRRISEHLVAVEQDLSLALIVVMFSSLVRVEQPAFHKGTQSSVQQYPHELDEKRRELGGPQSIFGNYCG